MPCDGHVMIGANKENLPIYFDYIADGIHDYKNDNGYLYLDSWIEKAVLKKRGYR